jgi:hypothetical protein
MHPSFDEEHTVSTEVVWELLRNVNFTAIVVANAPCVETFMEPYAIRLGFPHFECDGTHILISEDRLIEHILMNETFQLIAYR